MKLKSWKEVVVGAKIIESGTALEYKTGDWATFIPVVERDKCSHCLLCWLYCPDAAIIQKPDGFFTADLDYCKGCGICAHECWPRAIKMVEDEK